MTPRAAWRFPSTPRPACVGPCAGLAALPGLARTPGHWPLVPRPTTGGGAQADPSRPDRAYRFGPADPNTATRGPTLCRDGAGRGDRQRLCAGGGPDDRGKLSSANIKFYHIEPHTFPTKYFEEGDPFIDEIKATGLELKVLETS